MFCPKCGFQNVDNAQFCMKCGAQLGVGAAPGMGAGPNNMGSTPNMGPNMGPGPVPRPNTGTGLQPNVAALLSYLFGWITGLIFYFIEKDRFVRFHAMQSILVSGAFTVVILILALIPAPFFSVFFTIKSILSTLLWIGELAVIVLCMVKAYQNAWFKLPVAGDFAEKNCN